MKSLLSLRVAPFLGDTRSESLPIGHGARDHVESPPRRFDASAEVFGYSGASAINLNESTGKMTEPTPPIEVKACGQDGDSSPEDAHISVPAVMTGAELILASQSVSGPSGTALKLDDFDNHLYQEVPC